MKPGDTVQEVSKFDLKYLFMKFDDLVEVFTDKLVAKIPSTTEGVVKEISYEVDDICLVGHSLLSIEVEDGQAANVV